MQKKTSSISSKQAAVKQKNLILIVDDEFDLTSTFSMLFQLNGFDAITANNGRHALELMAQGAPDLILSDCMMPVMDGIQLARDVRGTPAAAHVPIILMSGVPQHQNLAEETGSAFIQKPFQFKNLLQMALTLLSASNAD